MLETWVRSLGWEDPLGKGIATHSSILAWRIWWTEDPGGLQFMESKGVRYDWAANTTIINATTATSYLLFCSVAKWCPTLCYPVDCGTPGFPVLHYLPEFAQTHVHWFRDAFQPSHPLLPLLLPEIFPSIRVFSNEWALCIRWSKYWSFIQLQHQSFQRIFRVDFL